jgi:hypothetical protein
MPPQHDGSDTRWEHRDGQTCHGPGPYGRDVGQQPHCDLAADDDHAIGTRTTISTPARSGEVERWWRGKPDGVPTFAATSVETELVALDVLHHKARLVVAIGRQKSHAYRAERDQPCAFGLKCGQALFTHEPGADPHVKMQPILDDLVFGNALEEQSRAHT